MARGIEVDLPERKYNYNIFLYNCKLCRSIGDYLTEHITEAPPKAYVCREHLNGKKYCEGLLELDVTHFEIRSTNESDLVKVTIISKDYRKFLYKKKGSVIQIMYAIEALMLSFSLKKKWRAFAK